VAEYISVTAAVSLVALTIGGHLGGRIAVLPTSNAAALELVTSGARAQKVSVSGAKAAFTRAPYEKPVLRYLYAAGWIGGKKHRTSCLLTRIAPSYSQDLATSEIQRDRRLKAQLRKRGVTARGAAGVLVQGVVSACS
jgi:hypothetical protein